ncbi:MAG: T9SS type A sorting domain-containing protein, partial [Candidatus Delongbacteria bacterium]|nr:T9SS type A sorting domain-containing protein [Candidatus Delongbacteria bacterium]
GSLDNGTLFIDFQGNDPMYANWWGGGVFSSFLGFRHGGDVAISMIDPNIQFFSTTGGTLHKRLIAEGQPTTRVGYYGYANGGAFISPVALWESWNDPKSWDSIMFIADRDYAAGETLIVESALGKRPLMQVLADPLLVGDTVKIQDTYQAMIAVGKNDGNAIKINRGAINPSSDVMLQRWYSVVDRYLLEDKMGEANTGNQVVEIAFSHDGNHIYTAIYHKDDGVYKLFRISNLENARSRSTMDATTGFNPETGERTYVETTTEIGQFSQIPTDIMVHPGNPDIVLVTCGNYGNDDYIYLATEATTAADSSMAFTSVQGNLPQAPAYAVMFNARDSKEVIVGTEYGAYSTTDIFAGTPTWASENGNGMDIVPVMGLKQQHLENNAERGIENHGAIYASTFGRGFFKSETFATKGVTGTSLVVNNTTNIEVSVMPNPVVDYAQVSYTMGADGDVSFEIFDLSGRVVKYMELNGQTAGEHQINIDASDLDAGTYLMRMNANSQRTTMKFMIK